jgi:hypothetical protein
MNGGEIPRVRPWRAWMSESNDAIPNLIAVDFLFNVITETSIANVLRPSLQDATCALFNVRREWLVRGEGSRLETALLDRSVDSWIRTLEGIQRRSALSELIVCRTRETEIEDDSCQGGALVLKWPVPRIEGNRVYAYQPVSTVRSWNDEESLYLAIRAMMVAEAMQFRLWGVTVHENEIRPLVEGTQWPSIVPDPCWLHSWHPVDYVDDRTSPCAKWAEVREWVLQRCEHDGSAVHLTKARERKTPPRLTQGSQDSP